MVLYLHSFIYNYGVVFKYRGNCTLYREEVCMVVVVLEFEVGLHIVYFCVKFDQNVLFAY